MYEPILSFQNSFSQPNNINESLMKTSTSDQKCVRKSLRSAAQMKNTVEG